MELKRRYLDFFLDYTCFSEKYNLQHKFKILGSEIDLPLLSLLGLYNTIESFKIALC